MHPHVKTASLCKSKLPFNVYRSDESTLTINGLTDVTARSPSHPMCIDVCTHNGAVPMIRRELLVLQSFWIATSVIPYYEPCWLRLFGAECLKKFSVSSGVCSLPKLVVLSLVYLESTVFAFLSTS